MNRIPFVHSRFSDPLLSFRAIETRLKRHWYGLRKIRRERAEAQSGGEGEADSLLDSDAEIMPFAVEQRTRRRARLISDHHDQLTPMALLKPEDRKRLEGLRDGIAVEKIATEHRADEIAAELHAEYPWLARATEHA